MISRWLCALTVSPNLDPTFLHWFKCLLFLPAGYLCLYLSYDFSPTCISEAQLGWPHDMWISTLLMMMVISQTNPPTNIENTCMDLSYVTLLFIICHTIWFYACTSEAQLGRPYEVCISILLRVKVISQTNPLIHLALLMVWCAIDCNVYSVITWGELHATIGLGYVTSHFQWTSTFWLAIIQQLRK